MVTSSNIRLLRESEQCLSLTFLWCYLLQAKSNISILLAMEERETGAEGLLGEARIPRSECGLVFHALEDCGTSPKPKAHGESASVLQSDPTLKLQ